MYKYNRDEAFKPFWKQKTMYNETVVMVKEGDNSPSGKLLFNATKILSVKDYTLEHVYSENEYTYEDGTITLKEGSSIPFLTLDQIHGIDMPDGFGFITQEARKENTKMAFTTGTGIIKHQIAVTYNHDDEWKGTTTPYYGDKLSRTMKKLEGGEPLKFLLYGDSIAAGCGSSSDLLIDPQLDDIGPGFVEELRRNFDSKIELVNKSQGGTMSNWGTSNVEGRVNTYNPDLVILAFGMNDGSAGVRPEDYKANIEGMIKPVLLKNPSTEFILISTILANPISKQDHRQKEYLAIHIELTNEYTNVVNVDLSSFTEELYKRKRGADILANHINHPSDFLIRCYIMNLASVFIK